MAPSSFFRARVLRAFVLPVASLAACVGPVPAASPAPVPAEPAAASPGAIVVDPEVIRVSPFVHAGARLRGLPEGTTEVRPVVDERVIRQRAHRVEGGLLRARVEGASTQRTAGGVR